MIAESCLFIQASIRIVIKNIYTFWVPSTFNFQNVSLLTFDSFQWVQRDGKTSRCTATCRQLHASQGVAQDALRVAQRFSCNAVYVRTREEEEGIKRQREKRRGREGAATNANALTQRNNVGEC